MKATWDREAEIKEIKRARNELMYLAPMFSVTPKDEFDEKFPIPSAIPPPKN